MSEEAYKEAIEKINERQLAIVNFLIEEVLTSRQSEKLIDKLAPRVKEDLINKIKNAMANPIYVKRGDG